MSSEDENLNPIRHLQEFDELSSGLISQPTKELEKRVKILERALASMASRGSITNILLQDKSVSDSVELYNCVFYNKVSGEYEPTMAKVEFTGNKFKTLRSGIVMGIVVKKLGSKADILVDGEWPLAALTASNNFLESGETYTAGVPYYLSAKESGRVTANPPMLAVQVFTGAEESLVMNKVYNSPHGFETSAKFEMGMRPVGDLHTAGNTTSIVGFHALEKGATYWSSTVDNAEFTASGYMAAEGWNLGYVGDPTYIDITVKTTGNIEVKTASSLATLGSATADIYSSPTVNELEPFQVTIGNYSDVRTLYLKNAEDSNIFKIKFNFITAGTFDLAKDRTTIFKVPDSFRGWKQLSGGSYQLQPYHQTAPADSDYPNYSHNPSNFAEFYYDTKSDPGFTKSWPPEPLDKSIVLVNGVEVLASPIVEAGASSSFEDTFANMGISEKTLYWVPSFGSVLPWDISYTRLISAVDGTHNESAKIAHLQPAAGEYWYWNEETYAYEPYSNRGWVYSNKLNVYYRSTQVMGVGVLPPLRVQDTLTGAEPSYEGESLTGNLLLWSESEDNVSQTTNSIQLGAITVLQSDAYTIYSNTTSHDVLLREIIFIVKSQNGTQLHNADLGVSYSAANSAVVNIGTGDTSGLTDNIVKNQKAIVHDWNTSAVMTLDAGSEIIPPNGVAKLSIAESFGIEQTVSIIVTGRIV